MDRLKEAFSLFDWDGSGALEKEELRDMLVVRACVVFEQGFPCGCSIALFGVVRFFFAAAMLGVVGKSGLSRMGRSPLCFEHVDSRTPAVSVRFLRSTSNTQAMGVEGAAEIATRELPPVPGLENPGLSFENTRKVLQQQAAARLQDGRFFVLLTLAEAEAVRAALHAAAVGGSHLTPDGNVTAALRSLLPGAEGAEQLAETVIPEAASGAAQHAVAVVPKAGRWQRTAAEQSFRFFDSMHDYSEYELDTLLNAIQARGEWLNDDWYMIG